MRGLKILPCAPISGEHTALANLRPIGCPVFAPCESHEKDI
jgi:hypothetical protein